MMEKCSQSRRHKHKGDSGVPPWNGQSHNAIGELKRVFLGQNLALASPAGAT